LDQPQLGQEARETSAALRAFSEIHESRVTYYLVYARNIC